MKESYICQELSPQYVDAVRILINTNLLDELSLCDHILPEDVLKFVLKQDPSSYCDLSYGIFQQKLNRAQLFRILRKYNRCVELEDKNTTAMVEAEGIVGQPYFDNDARKELLKNHDFIYELSSSIEALTMLFPSMDMVVDEMLKKPQDELNKAVIKVILNSFSSPPGIDKIIAAYPLSQNYCEMRTRIIQGHALSIPQLKAAGVPEKAHWALCKKGENIRPPNISMGPFLVGANMDEDLTQRCMKSKNPRVLEWMSVVGPKHILPVLLGVNDYISERVALRLDGKDISPELRCESVSRCLWFSNYLDTL